ncbi:hypothetical protein GCM10009674_30370 [Nesterenkonia xinjiangensis]
MNRISDQDWLPRAGLGVTALAALTLTGCASGEDLELEDDESTSHDEGAEEAGETADPQGAADEDGAGVDEEDLDADPTGAAEGDGDAPEEDDTASAGPLDPDDAIEAIAYEVPGESSSTIDVGLHDLRVEDDVMLLELSFTGDFAGDDAKNIYTMFSRTAVYPELNDRENLTQYTVIGDSHNRWATDSTNSGVQYESGQTAPYWAYYPAPVDDIETIAVTVVPGAVEFEDVEIDWDGNEHSDVEDGE